MDLLKLEHFQLTAILWPASNENADQFKNIEQGAATSVWCATSTQLDGMGGVYCEDCDISEAVPINSLNDTGVRPWAIDANLAKNLWQLSVKILRVLTLLFSVSLNKIRRVTITWRFSSLTFQCFYQSPRYLWYGSP